MYMHDDDDFMGNIEFDLTPEQADIVSRAISLAAKSGDSFGNINPLISILQWWQANFGEGHKNNESPEMVLTDACRQFLLAHEALD
jgi:hypothetical protein